MVAFVMLPTNVDAPMVLFGICRVVPTKALCVRCEWRQQNSLAGVVIAVAFVVVVVVVVVARRARRHLQLIQIALVVVVVALQLYHCYYHSVSVR